MRARDDTNMLFGQNGLVFVDKNEKEVAAINADGCIKANILEGE
ncbi:hypothetical protein [Lactobacillus sp. ESL0677]|nr:hypothetical protein [Lactobacillus sp. ESL0677]WEV36202.1 hypothetical protein OZX76_05500 [Lactobacillus sp. ESL0677]